MLRANNAEALVLEWMIGLWVEDKKTGSVYSVTI